MEKIKVINKTKIMEYPNGVVIFILPEYVNWIKTSSSGKWIFGLMENEEFTIEELIKTVSDYYQLPANVIEKPTKLLIDQFFQNGIVSIGGKKINNEKQISINDMGLQEIWLNITNVCNLKCMHCYNPEINEKPGFIDFSFVKKIVQEAHEMKVKSIILTGGEPLLHPQLADIVSYIKENSSLLIKLITNGTILNKTILGQIVPLIDDIQISLDGVTENIHDSVRGTGSYRKTIDFFNFIHEMNPQKIIGISFTPLPDNVHEIPQLYELSYRLYSKYIKLNRPKRPASACSCEILNMDSFLSKEFFEEAIEKHRMLLKKYYEDLNMDVGIEKVPRSLIDNTFDPSHELLSRIKRERCAAGVLTLCISHTGNCYPCAALTNLKSFGNLHELPLKDIYYLSKGEMTKCFSVNEDDECKLCDFKYFCGGGCRANAENISNHDPYCHFIKERFDSFLQSIIRSTSDAEERDDEIEDKNKNSIFSKSC